MRLNIRFLYLLPVLALVFTDHAFTEFVFPDKDSPLLASYGLLLLGGSCGIVALCYR